MIISKFNKYVERHGRVTYIVLGAIICLAFVVFVTPDGAGSGGCSSNGRVRSMGNMYGKNISVDEFIMYRNMADLTCYMRYNVLLSNYNEEMLNQETYNRIRSVRAAKKYGFYKQVTDAEVAKNIQENPAFKEDDAFSLKTFTNFKENMLPYFKMKAGDFDELIRQNLAMQKMQDEQTKDVTVSDAEVDAELSEYALSYAEIKADGAKAAAPTQEEIDKFYATRKNELVPDKLRSALLASFKLEQFINAATIKDADIAKMYEAQKNNKYKGKSLEQVKAEIGKQLKEDAARAAMRKAATALNDKLIKETEKLDAKAAMAKAQELAKAANAAVVVTPMFSGATLPDVKASPAAVRVINMLNKAGELAKVPAMTPNEATVVMLADIKDGVLPEKLDAATTVKVQNALIGEKALDFYAKNVAKYIKVAPGTQSYWQLAADEQQALQDDIKLDTTAKQAAMIELSDFIRDYVAPFYHDEQRAFAAVAFKPADYEKDIVITDADIQKAFDAKADEYGKVEVRLNRITVKSAEADTAEAKAAAKKKIEDASAQLIAGKAFADVAKAVSEDDSKDKGGDIDFVDVKTLDEAVQKQLEKMSIGQLSPVIATKDGYCIIKLAEKKGPRTLEVVRPELLKSLTLEKTKKAATDAAEKLRAEVASGDVNEASLKKAVAGTKGKVETVAKTIRNNRLANGAASDASLMRAVFATTAAAPLTEVVDGKDAVYVACLVDIAPAFVEDKKECDAALKNVYTKYIGIETAKKEAEAQYAKISEALKGGAELKAAAGDLVFKAAESKLSNKTIGSFKDFSVRNIYGMTAELGTANVKALIKPQRGYFSYYLVYLDSKEVPASAVAEKDSTREQLLNQKKNEALNAFYQKMQAESDLKNVPDFINKKIR